MMLISEIVRAYIKVKEISVKSHDVTKKKFVAAAYDKVISKLNTYHPNSKVTVGKIKKLGLSATMQLKLVNMYKKHKLVSSGTGSGKGSGSGTGSGKGSGIKSGESKSESVQFLKMELQKTLGIGEVLATKLVNSGLNHFNQIHRKKYKALLPESVKIMLNLKPERKIPSSIIAKMTQLTKFPGAEIVGSYRRSAAISRDIDIMVVSDRKDAMLEYLKTLKPSPTIYLKGRVRSSFIWKFDDRQWKIDVFICPRAQAVPMRLYAIGSKEFNIKIRAVARKKGYLLNQKGLFVVKIVNGSKQLAGVAVKSDRDIFRILGLPYVAPSDR
jgi:DNA polymerase/3'-5' exonuclease PolX